jgi:hypothetical protein
MVHFIPFLFIAVVKLWGIMLWVRAQDAWALAITVSFTFWILIKGHFWMFHVGSVSATERMTYAKLSPNTLEGNTVEQETFIPLVWANLSAEVKENTMCR